MGCNQKKHPVKWKNLLIFHYKYIHTLIHPCQKIPFMAQCSVTGAIIILSQLGTSNFYLLPCFKTALRGKWYKDTNEVIIKVI